VPRAVRGHTLRVVDADAYDWLVDARHPDAISRRSKTDCPVVFEGRVMATLRIGRVGRTVVAVGLAVACASCGLRLAGGTSANRPSEEEIRSLETRLREAVLTRSTDVLQYMLADDYTNTNEFGVVRNKAQVIADIESGDNVREAIDLDDINVNLYGSAAVLTAKRTVRGRGKRSDPSGQFRQLRVYAIRQGRWQAVMLQVTRIAE
jgi:hypothetical protein